MDTHVMVFNYSDVMLAMYNVSSTQVCSNNTTTTLFQSIGLFADCDHSVPLGMISGDIQDWQLSASSTYPQEWDKNCHERYARVYQVNGRGWCARYKTSSEWLQVDLGVAAKVGLQSISRTL